MKNILPSFALILICLICNAQEVSTIKTFDLVGNLYPSAISKCADDNFIVAGSHQGDAFVVKLNAEADTIWTLHYGSSDKIDELRDVVALNDSLYVGVGRTNFETTTDFLLFGDLLLLAFSDKGEIIWTKQYGSDRNDEGYKIIKSVSGGFLACGVYDNCSPNGTGDYWLLRCNEQGDTLWTRKYSFENFSSAKDLHEAANGDIFLIGSGIHLVQLDKNGIEINEFNIAGRYADHFIKKDNTFILSGNDEKGSFVCELKADANQNWRNYYNAVNSDLLITNDNSILVLAKDGPVTSFNKLCLRKLSSSGSTQWYEELEMGSDITSFVAVNYSENKYLLAGSIKVGSDNKLLIMQLVDESLGTTRFVEKKTIVVESIGNSSVVVQLVDENIHFGDIQIFNMNGQEVTHQKIYKARTQINFQQTGVYLYRFQSETGHTQSGKIRIN